MHPDVSTLRSLPFGIDLVTAGFPCTDLSQAGRTAGITGEQSGLVGHVFRLLTSVSREGRSLPSLLIENVPNMLVLDGGQAIAFLAEQLESFGYRWAYRVVDSRFTGVPQRRRRVVLLASTEIDPREVLFADNESAPSEDGRSEDAFGFYWTEGRGGLGWARDAVPTLKAGPRSGSRRRLPSGPAISPWSGGSSSRRSRMPRRCRGSRVDGPMSSSTSPGHAESAHDGSSSGTR